MTEPENHANLIWSVADLLRGDDTQSEHGNATLPVTVIRRPDCVLEPTKTAVLEKRGQLATRIENLEPVLPAACVSNGWGHHRPMAIGLSPLRASASGRADEQSSRRRWRARAPASRL